MSAHKNAQVNAVPIIDSAALPSTPAQEWADSTRSALQSKVPADSTKQATPLTTSGTMTTAEGNGVSHNSTTPPFVSSSSSGSTPGNEFPGAFPRDRPAPVEGIAGAVVDTAYGILESAKQCLPAQEQVQNAIENASTTAKHYLPESVGTYLPGGTQNSSLPSTEVYGNMGRSSDGVGALPGHLSEVSVAKLPEERKQEGLERAKEFSVAYAQDQTPSTHTPALTGGAGDLPGSTSGVGLAQVSEKKAINGNRDSLYTNDPLSPTIMDPWSTPIKADSDASRIPLPPTPARPSHGGVLAPTIPAVDNNISGGLSAQFDNIDLTAAANVHDSAMYDAAKATGVEPHLDEGSVGHTGGPLIPVAVPAVPKVRSASDGEDKQRIMKDWEAMNEAVMMDTDEDMAAKLAATNARMHHHHQQQAHEHEKEKRASLSSSGSGNGRPSFMDKIKGEAKIISGKLAKNEEKVEEGKRMMGKV